MTQIIDEKVRPVKPKLAKESRRCKSITNKETGFVFLRPPTPHSRWDIIFQHAVFNKSDFIFEFDSKFENKDDDEPRYTEQELRSLSMNSLRLIGERFRLTSNSKDKLVIKILDAQKSGVKPLKEVSLEDHMNLEEIPVGD
jgi:hypothetical protein